MSVMIPSRTAMDLDRAADADLRRRCAAMLYRCADAVQSGQVPRWQILSALSLVQRAARLLRPATDKTEE